MEGLGSVGVIDATPPAHRWPVEPQKHNLPSKVGFHQECCVEILIAGYSDLSGLHNPMVGDASFVEGGELEDS
jgi:hypothetical protein